MIYVLLIVELVLLAVLAPSFALLASILIAATYRRILDRTSVDPNEPPSSHFLILIPAHDEAGVIQETVRSCLALNYPPAQFQVWVIADNCTDTTAKLAEAAGAQVVERTDLARKSKGFALADFFGGVATNPLIRPFDAYVLVDADTSVGPDLLRAFDQSLRQGADFVQGYYTVRNANASWRTRLMTYAFSIVNGVWLMGLDQLGLSVGLKGNGMCFRRIALDHYPWQVHGLVEDMEYAWNLRINDARVRFQPRAEVYGEMVSRGGSGAASQRQRWESGRQALRSSVRPQLWSSSRLNLLQKIAYQIDLSFPPLSRLVVGLGLVSLVNLGGIWLSAATSNWMLLGLILVALWALLTIYLLSPLVLIGLPFRYLGSLVFLPYYMLWKLTVRMVGGQSAWVRTPREGKKSA